MKNIILMGMPGAGKSTLGVVLSKKIGYGFIDSDSVIVAREGKRLCELIEELGNEGFLDVEAKVNSAICASRCVISTGGSAVYRADAINKMKENGIVVYLKLSYEEICRRLGDLKKRGVVLKQGFTFRDLFDERVPLYEALADYTVELDGNSIEENAEKIRRAIECELTE